LGHAGKKLPSREDDTWYSIFPVENEDLVYGRYEGVAFVWCSGTRYLYCQMVVLRRGLPLKMISEFVQIFWY
jgi:hypothetical protein